MHNAILKWPRSVLSNFRGLLTLADRLQVGRFYNPLPGPILRDWNFLSPKSSYRISISPAS